MLVVADPNIVAGANITSIQNITIVMCVVILLMRIATILKMGKTIVSFAYWKNIKGEVNMRKSKIINNRAYTDGDTGIYTDLPLDIQKALIKWIERNIYGRKTANLIYSSYDLKHCAERNIKYYITNNQFKDAMLYCGFYPVNPKELNWYYKIVFKGVR